MNVLSLFDGMSCGQIALNRLGIKYDNYYASEIDKYSIKVTMKNYPNTIQLGDVTKIKGKDLPKIDLLIGGSPCQGFSFAGKQLNFEDPRSKLFFEYVRLLKELKPKYFLLENVKMKKESQDIISKYLGVEPIEICSSLVSAQSRKRLYWTNKGTTKNNLFMKKQGIEQPKDKGIKIKDVIGTYCDIVINQGKEAKKININKGSCLLARDYKGFGNQGQTGVRVEGGLWRKLTPSECERLQTVPDNYTEGVSNTQRYKMLGNGWTVDVICHIFKNLLNKKKGYDECIKFI
jgi:DNA-cytosine methyltransferase